MTVGRGTLKRQVNTTKWYRCQGLAVDIGQDGLCNDDDWSAEDMGEDKHMQLFKALKHTLDVHLLPGMQSTLTTIKHAAYIHCVIKNIPNIFDCNLKDYQTLIVFSTNIPETKQLAIK